MTRFEECIETLRLTREAHGHNPSGTFDQMLILHMSTIVVLLADIAKSLAIIADKEAK